MAILTALMSCYNSERWVGEAIENVLCQTFSDFELLIIDDGSSDTTVLEIRRFRDSRIRLVQLPLNVGVGAALNLGLGLVQSPLIAKVDSDDINHPSRFLRQIQFLDKYREVTLVKTGIEFFPDTPVVAASARFNWLSTVKAPALNALRTHAEISGALWDWCCISHNSYMAHAPAVKSVGYPPWRVFEDYALFYRLNERGSHFAGLDEVLVDMRVSPLSTTGLGTTPSLPHLLELKSVRLKQLIKGDREVCVLGGGGLAAATTRYLTSIGRGFVQVVSPADTPYDSAFSADLTDPLTYNETKDSHVFLVTCQPIRDGVTSALKSLGLQSGKDFLVMA
jgi:glycosyltransferase involved in cell wall biosynthesis